MLSEEPGCTAGCGSCIGLVCAIVVILVALTLCGLTLPIPLG